MKFGHIGIVQRGLPRDSTEEKNTGILEARGYFIKTRKAPSGTTKKNINLRNRASQGVHGLFS